MAESEPKPYLREKDGRYHTLVPPDEGMPPSIVVCEAIEEVADERSMNVDVELFSAIEADALDSMYRHAQDTGAEWELEFSAEPFRVTVRSTGEVVIG